MSANNLLVNGLINPALVPASAIPANPVFQSVAIAPDAGIPGVLSVENPTGSACQVIKELDGSVNIYQETAPNVYGSVFAVDSGATFVTVRAPEVKLGIESDATPTVEVLGSAGLGQVYDERYNPVVRDYTPYPPLDISTINGQQTVPITPTKTGLYNLCLSLSFINTSTIGTGVIEWYLLLSGGEVFGGSNTIVPSDFVLPSGSGGASGPLDWTYNQFVYLTAGSTYTFTIQPWGTGWAGVGGLLSSTYLG